MSVDYRSAVRRSFLAKIAIFLQQDGLRDMSVPLNFNQGVAEYFHGSTVYGVVPRIDGEDLFYPGINITFFNDTDLSSGRSVKKRYLLTAKIVITKAIEGNTTPILADMEVSAVTHRVLEALSDCHVQIWDYDLSPPAFTGVLGSFHESNVTLEDESMPFSGGDIRQAINLAINYSDQSF